MINKMKGRDDVEESSSSRGKEKASLSSDEFKKEQTDDTRCCEMMIMRSNSLSI